MDANLIKWICFGIGFMFGGIFGLFGGCLMAARKISDLRDYFTRLLDEANTKLSNALRLKGIELDQAKRRIRRLEKNGKK